VEVLVWLEDVWRRGENVVEELCEKKSCALVLLFLTVELVFQIAVLILESIIFLALNDEVLLVLLQLLLQEIDQVLIPSVVSVWHATHSGHLRAFGNAASCVLEILLQPFDHLLTEVRPLGQLFLDFLVDLGLTLVRFNLLLHLVVLDDEELGLLGLVFEFGGQLVVLEDGEASRGLELFVVECEEVGLGLLDRLEHFLPQLLCFLDPVSFLLIYLFESAFLLIVEVLLQIFDLLELVGSLVGSVLIDGFELLLEVILLLDHFIHLLLVLALHLVNLFLLELVDLLDFVLQKLNFVL